MSSTSPNFNLVLATASDIVDVTAHVANNFSSLDAIVGVSHTGSGELKGGLVINSPTLNTPVLNTPTLTGTVSVGVLVGSTGHFNTITATGGTIRVSSLSMATYSFPATASANGTILTLSAGNAVWAANTPGTGANTALSNLVSVAINTNLNTFTAGFVTVARVLATSGALTGLTTFQATTGTFAGNLVVSATLSANVLNCTGGTITAASFKIGTYGYPTTAGATGQMLVMTTGNAVWGTSVGTLKGVLLTASTLNSTLITATTLTAVTLSASTLSGLASLSVGTYSYPATIGSTAQVLTVTTGNAVWLDPVAPSVSLTKSYFMAFATAGDDLNWSTATSVPLQFSKEVFDSGNNYDTAQTSYQFTVPSSGYYIFGAHITTIMDTGNILKNAALSISESGGTSSELYRFFLSTGTFNGGIAGSCLVLATSGAKYGVFMNWTSGGNVFVVTGTAQTYFYGYKIPDS